MLLIQDLQKITAGKWLIFPKDQKQKIWGAHFDSRKINKEQIFFCWEGMNSDGHLYLEQLQDTSIKVAIVQKEIPQKVTKKLSYAVLQVANSLESLHKLAYFIAQNCKLPILAITGSSGKTTAKSWLFSLLAEKYKVLTNYQNFNNHIGCPLTLLNLSTENFILLEMGTSCSGEIQQLVNIVQPQYSLLLNVGLAHIACFGTKEKIYQEKMSIFTSPRLKLGFLNHQIATPKTSKQWITYGTGTPYQCKIQKIDLKKKKTSCKIQFHSQQKDINFPMIAYHLQETIPMLLCVGDYFGMDFPAMIQSIQKLDSIQARMELSAYSNHRWIIDDSYNGNPNSVIQLLKTMALCEGYQKIAVIGFLAELEDGLAISSQYLAENIPQQIDKLYFLGNTGKQFVENLTHLATSLSSKIFFVSETELLQKLSQEFQKNSLLAFKASRAAKLENLIEKVKQRVVY